MSSDNDSEAMYRWMQTSSGMLIDIATRTGVDVIDSVKLGIRGFTPIKRYNSSSKSSQSVANGVCVATACWRKSGHVEHVWNAGEEGV